MSPYLTLEVRLVGMSTVLGFILMASYDFCGYSAFCSPWAAVDGDRGFFLLDLCGCHDVSSAVLREQRYCSGVHHCVCFFGMIFMIKSLAGMFSAIEKAEKMV